MLKVDHESVTVRHTKYRKIYSGPWTIFGPYETVSDWINTTIGEDNPRWRWQVRNNRNATTPYTKRHYNYFSLNDGKCSSNVVQTDQYGNQIILAHTGHPLNWFHGGMPDPASLDTTEADKDVTAKFIGKYRERRTAFQGGIFLGELHQTVNMIKSPARALREAVTHYYRSLKKKIRGAPRPKRVIRDSWLEFQYGVKPLVSDIEDACKLGTVEPFKVFQPIKAQIARSVFRTTIDYRDDIWSKVQLVATKRSEGLVICVIKGVASFENSPPSFPEQLGFSWSNVLPTGWELIPYSFLIDYFTNIGKVIEGISTGTVYLSWGYKTSSSTCSSTIYGGHLDQGLLDQLKPEGGSVVGFATADGPFEEHTYYTRGPVDSVSLGIRDFHFKTPGSNTKWLNIAALARWQSGNPAHLRI